MGNFDTHVPAVKCWRLFLWRNIFNCILEQSSVFIQLLVVAMGNSLILCNVYRQWLYRYMTFVVCKQITWELLFLTCTFILLNVLQNPVCRPLYPYEVGNVVICHSWGTVPKIYYTVTEFLLVSLCVLIIFHRSCRLSWVFSILFCLLLFFLFLFAPYV